MKKLDLSGHQFGRLTVISEDPVKSGVKIKWLCACSCGGSVSVAATHLRSGHTMSCGCVVTDMLEARNGTHGLSKTRLYRVWCRMRQRCRDPKVREWKHYGGRGIYVCDRWSDYTAFANDMGECPPGLTLDRIDNDGPYSPDNCRWTDWTTQSNNRRKAA